MREKSRNDSCRPERETDEEFEIRMNAEADEADTTTMRPYTRSSDLPFVRMGERYGGAVMRDDCE